MWDLCIVFQKLGENIGVAIENGRDVIMQSSGLTKAYDASINHPVPTEQSTAVISCHIFS
jgi:hypothetical protein